MKMNEYSITYKSITDPTEQEQISLINELKDKKIIILDAFSGCILVKGEEPVINHVLNSYPKWSKSLNKKTTSVNPKKKIIPPPSED